ncbi:M20 family metallopeptidase [Prauserella halophila]|uniref:Peptidase M20 domain-containing protein 2 n=1 Tax=Prauserella halophila TaxID=185641 RepID=A0ABP4GTW6_9PSEU|nr:M20 family metallopeptidase [Prauserella halophila]MCP2236232.1 amidohydrolase [Prauserella halophila]
MTIHQDVTAGDLDIADARWLSELDGYLTELQPTIIEVSRQIHAKPEIRFEEHFAARLLTDTLQRHGFAVEHEVAGLKTAFAARLNRPGHGEGTRTSSVPTIAIFCEYDALEGIGHGCGHNIIAAAGLGAALATARWLRAHPEFPGDLVVIGSPGEEGGGGKSYLVDAGCLDGVDTAMMIHPTSENRARMASLARVSLDVTFTGRAAHASASPHDGINALDAVNLTHTAIGLLRQQVQPDTRIHGIVTDGGEAPNIIPERAAMRLFVRSPDTGYLHDRLLPAVENCARGAALATGCQVEITQYAPPYASMRTNEVLGRLCAGHLAHLGRTPMDELPSDGTGSTDMGNVSEVVPSVHPCLQLVPGITLHTREAAEAACGSEGDRAAVDGARLLALTGTQLYSAPQLLTAVKAAFDPNR